MLEFLFGLTIGIYIGTFYNCKPVITKVNDVIHTYIEFKK